MTLLSKATTGRLGRAQKVVIYAPEGYGKSTLASQFPSPIFADIEDSTSQLDVQRLGRDVLTDLKTFEQFVEETRATYPGATLVVDTIDWLEQMAVDDIIATASSPKIQGIEDFGYGKGYTALKERLTATLTKLDRVIQAGIHVVLLAHSRVVKFEAPDGVAPFDRYELKLSKHVAPLIKEWADMLLFGNWRLQIREKDKNEPGQQHKGVGGKERLMHCVRCAAWDAKNRHGLGDVEKWEIATIEKAFKSVNAPWGRGGAAPAAPAPASAPAKAAPAAKPKPTPAAKPAAVEKKEEPKPAAETPASAAPVEETKPAETTTPPCEASQGDDEIPGIANPTTAPQIDQDLAKVCEPHSEKVTNYLIRKGKIKKGQTWANVDQAFRDRIVHNPAGFLAVAAR